MVNVSKVVKSAVDSPGYTMMRGVARFSPVRHAVAAGRRTSHMARSNRYVARSESEMATSMFRTVDRDRFLADLRDKGCALGLSLDRSIVSEIVEWSTGQPCYADRDARHGFLLKDLSSAERVLKKPILLAQYFNAFKHCEAIGAIASDPFVQWVAHRYLGSIPTFVGANLWWTFPAEASDSERDKSAQVFHRDVDDFRFFKFFFYLTDVDSGDGGHVCVERSHHRPPNFRRFDRWTIRRYTDAEIADSYSGSDIREIVGAAGTGFAENTLCVHKGKTPKHQPRLLLQLQFALFDYGVMSDERDECALVQLLDYDR